MQQARAVVGDDVELFADTNGGYGPKRAIRVMDAAADLDVRCGGITEWLRVAAVAASYGLEISGHCAPHLHAHAAAAVPNLRRRRPEPVHHRRQCAPTQGAANPGAVRLDPGAAAIPLPSRIVPHRDGCDPETIDVRLTGAGYTHELIELTGQLGVRVIEGPAELP